LTIVGTIRIADNSFVEDNIRMSIQSIFPGGYSFRMTSSEELRLNKVTNGAESILFDTESSYVSANTDYRIKITRSLAGVFTVYIKGGAFGWDSWTTVSVAGGSGSNPVTDNTYTTSNYFVCDIDTDDTISDLEIDGKPIMLSHATVSTGTWSVTKPSYSFDGTDDIITVGNVGTTAKTLSFWMNPVSTTESILEETDDVGVSISTGTMTYPSWDNCYVNGVDTDTATTGWHHIVLTSTTNVDVSAFRLGLVDATYFEGELAEVKANNITFDATQVEQEYNRMKWKYGE